MVCYVAAHCAARGIDNDTSIWPGSRIRIVTYTYNRFFPRSNENVLVGCHNSFEHYGEVESVAFNLVKVFVYANDEWLYR